MRELRTRGEEALAELQAVAKAASLSKSESDAASTVADLVLSPCAWVRHSTTAPFLPSGFSHRRPFSVSVTAGDRLAAASILFEPQAETRSAAAYFQIGIEVARRIEVAIPDASSARLTSVLDLFTPTWEGAPFRIWFASRFVRANAARAKVYLCPSARGQDRDEVRRTVDEALRRLGAAPNLAERVAAEAARPNVDPTIVSLDLHRGADARVKAYLLFRDHALAETRSLLGEALYEKATDLVSSVVVDGGGSSRDTTPTMKRWLVSLASSAEDSRTMKPTIHIPMHDVVTNGDRERMLERLLSWSKKQGFFVGSEAMVSVRSELGPKHRVHFVALRETDLTVHYAPPPPALAPP